MDIVIALFRGINVGGKNSLPMKDVVSLFKDLGLNKIQTYIQSGNVVFQSERIDKQALSQEIRIRIENQFGFMPMVILLTADQFREAIVLNPFQAAENNPKSLHLFFLALRSVNPDIKLLKFIKTKTERFKLINMVFYLHAPDGIGRSKLAANVEKALRVSVTGRNWQSVNHIMAIVKDSET